MDNVKYKPEDKVMMFGVVRQVVLLGNGKVKYVIAPDYEDKNRYAREVEVDEEVLRISDDKVIEMMEEENNDREAEDYKRV